jgi:hypothetical protein
MYQYHPKFLLYSQVAFPDASPNWETLLSPGELQALKVLLAPHAHFTHSEADRTRRSDWEQSIRPFALWVELCGRANGVRTPSGNERIQAMSLACYLKALPCLNERDKVNLTGNAFHPDEIAMRLQGNCHITLASIIRGEHAAPKPSKRMSPHELLEFFNIIRAEVVADPELVSHAVMTPFRREFMWTLPIIACAKRFGAPGACGLAAGMTGWTLMGPSNLVTSATIKQLLSAHIGCRLAGPNDWNCQRAPWNGRNAAITISTSNIIPEDMAQENLQCGSVREAVILAVLHSSTPDFMKNHTCQSLNALLERTRDAELTSFSTPIRDSIGFGSVIAASLPNALQLAGIAPVNLWIMKVAQKPGCKQWSISEGQGEFMFEMRSDASWILLLAHGKCTISQCQLTVAAHPVNFQRTVPHGSISSGARFAVPHITLHQRALPIQLQVARKLGLQILAETAMHMSHPDSILSSLALLLKPFRSEDGDSKQEWTKALAAWNHLPIQLAMPSICADITSELFGCISIRDIAGRDCLSHHACHNIKADEKVSFPTRILLFTAGQPSFVHIAVVVAGYNPHSAVGKERANIEWEIACPLSTHDDGIAKADSTMDLTADESTMQVDSKKAKARAKCKAKARQEANGRTPSARISVLKANGKIATSNSTKHVMR